MARNRARLERLEGRQTPVGNDGHRLDVQVGMWSKLLLVRDRQVSTDDAERYAHRALEVCQEYDTDYHRRIGERIVDYLERIEPNTVETDPDLVRDLVDLGFVPEIALVLLIATTVGFPPLEPVEPSAHRDRLLARLTPLDPSTSASAARQGDTPSPKETPS